MKELRIVKETYSSGKIEYQIQQKWLWWWVVLENENWRTLDFARDRVKDLMGTTLISKEIVE